MKTLHFAFALLVCIGFCDFALGQESPETLKFDTYSEKEGVNLKLLDEKARRFAEHLQKLPKGTKGVIFFFQSVKKFRCWEDKYAEKQQFSYVVNFVSSNNKKVESNCFTA